MACFLSVLERLNAWVGGAVAEVLRLLAKGPRPVPVPVRVSTRR